MLIRANYHSQATDGSDDHLTAGLGYFIGNYGGLVDLDPAGTNPDPVNVPDQDFGFWDPTPSAVTIIDFWSTLDSGSVLLHWETATELNNLGFYIERAESRTGQRTRLNADLILSQLTGATYEYPDTAVQPGLTYYYWLVTVDTDLNAFAYGPISQRLGTGTYTVYLPLVDR